MPGRRHLATVPTQPNDVSLDFALMCAVGHAERGDFNAMLTALGDCLWLQHRGKSIGEDRLRKHLRDLLGFEWAPPREAA